MKTTEENERIAQLATALLKRRGVEQPTFAEYADAAYIAAEAVEKKGLKVTVAEMLAIGAIGGSVPDPGTARILAHYANEGKFVADGSLDQETLLGSVIRAEQPRGADSILAESAPAVCAHGYPGGKADGCPYCK